MQDTTKPATTLDQLSSLLASAREELKNAEHQQALVNERCGKARGAVQQATAALRDATNKLLA